MDHIAFLQNGKVLCEKEIDNLRNGFSKIQFVLEEQNLVDEIMSKLNVLSSIQNGKVRELVVGDSKDCIETVFGGYKTILLEIFQLDLEEIFVAIMVDEGYEIKKGVK